MKLSRKNISRGILAYIFFLIALQPAAFQHFSMINRIYLAAQILMLLIVGYLSFGRLNKGSFSGRKVCLMMMVYYAYFICNTFFNHGRTRALTEQAVQFVGFALYLDIVLKENPKEIFRSALNILTVFVAVNCLLTIILKDGLYTTTYYTNNYLLGYDNQNINFILPTMVLVLLKNECYRRCGFQIIITYALAWITAVRIWSGMTLVVTALLTIVAVFFIRRKNGFFLQHIFTSRIFNFGSLLIVDILANIALVVLRLQYYLENIIVNVLHRDLTLTNRTIIWDRTFSFIMRRPWFGYGRENYGERAFKYGFRENSPVGLHAHNRMLETIYGGGIVMIIIFLWILFYAAGKLREVKDTAFAKILSLGIFIYLIGMLTEYYDYCIFLWGFLVMAENSSRILKQLNPANSTQSGK